jgi:hypothetical protein
MPLVTKSDFARSRGRTPGAVTAAIKCGRIKGAVVTKDGKEFLDFDKANELWDRNTEQQPPPTRKADTPPPTRKAKAPAPIKPPSDQDLQAFIQGLPEDQIPDLNDSRARREHYLAEKARLDALRGRDELIPADQVKAEAFALARAVRDGMLGIADRLAPQLAATTDARQVHILMTDEIRVALRGLADG